ncbi:hypothetical protein HKD37_01G002472 [Glycine soja]
MSKINKKAEKMFNIVPYGEISRSFAVRWKNELEHIWHILHSSGKHVLCYIPPRSGIVARWTELREFYRIIGNHQVTLTHFGQSIFLLTIFKSSFEQKSSAQMTLLVPSISLTEYKVTYNNLDVLNIMYSFMKAAGFTHLNLEGTTECRIVYNNWRKTTKIRNG